MMDRILDNEISDSLKASIKKRLNSSIYGTFIIYWAIFHWEFLFAMFFVNEDKIWDSMKLFKNDYLTKTFFDYTSFTFYILWLIPFILTYLTIFVFPKYIIIPAFKQEKLDEKEKDIFNIRQEREITKERSLLNVDKVVEAGTEVNKIEVEKKVLEADPMISWSREYRDFEKSGNHISYSNFLNTFYSGSKYLHQFLSSDIAYFDALGLIDLQSNMIDSLTPKGKYFALRSKEKIAQEIPF